MIAQFIDPPEVVMTDRLRSVLVPVSCRSAALEGICRFAIYDYKPFEVLISCTEHAQAYVITQYPAQERADEDV